MYNTLFAFCSFGGKLDDSINDGKGPYVFRVTWQVYHNVGSLIQPDRTTPKFAQLYMYDGQHANEHRLNFTRSLDDVNRSIIATLADMLNQNNVLVKIFSQVRERFGGMEELPIRLRLFERRATDGHFRNMQSEEDYKIDIVIAENNFEFAALVVDNDFVNKRDIVVHSKSQGLQHINELHPCYMSPQYLLLFSFGEDGYRAGIKHRNVDGLQNQRNNTVSIREYYAYRAQYRVGEGHAQVLGGRLFL